MMYTRSGLTWAEADMARSRNMSSCSSAVMKRADDGGGADVRGRSCADGGTKAVAVDTNDMIPIATENMVASVMLGEVFMVQGSSGDGRREEGRKVEE